MFQIQGQQNIVLHFDDFIHRHAFHWGVGAADDLGQAIRTDDNSIAAGYGKSGRRSGRLQALSKEIGDQALERLPLMHSPDFDPMQQVVWEVQGRFHEASKPANQLAVKLADYTEFIEFG
jgi:hypothetical protein